ncbi:MAG: nuclear transport factor 2 family protein [Oligoflexia bacterium]|nr:nuclear transport factor 2 family protein [Oligoflexia bacterium]
MQDERTLAVQREIQETAFKYSDALNRRDWRLFETCWIITAGSEIQGSKLVYKKHDSILVETKALLDKMDLFFQITHVGIVDVAERGAKARFPLQQWSRFTDDQREVKTVGFFEDEWKRGHAGFWQIEKRTLIVAHEEEERILNAPASEIPSVAQPA